MSRNVPRGGRTGRQAMSSVTTRIGRYKPRANDSYQEKVDKKHKAGAKTRGKGVRQPARRRQPSPISEESSSAGGSDTGDEASDEESESEEDDEPPVVAPSRRRPGASKMGPNRKSRVVDRASLPDSSVGGVEDYQQYYGEEDDPRLSPEENRKRFEDKVFADSNDEDDDDVYRAVDEISDSDDGETEQFEEQYLAASFSENELANQDLYLNQIDGFSAYGFGDDSDGSVHFPSSQDSDSGVDHVPLSKHVHFHVDDHSDFLMVNSPTITRALLPSALPDLQTHSSATAVQSRQELSRATMLEDPDDSDLTDDCLPEQAHHSTPNVLQRQAPDPAEPSSPPVAKPEFKKPARRRGPPRGIFIDEGDKTSGILDPSGKVILMTNPHLLGEEFARRYGTSQTSSPDAGFDELLDETDQSDTPPESQSLVTFHGMAPVSDLNTTNTISRFTMDDFGTNRDHFNLDFADLEESEMPDGEIALEDVIRWDDDDSEDEGGMTSPIFMPPSRELSNLSGGGNEFAHLMNGNVTAFRRNADPTFSAFNSIPTFDFGQSTPPVRRKRRVESPYTSSHYKGVTPVQRVRDPNQSYPPVSQHSSKRRKLTI